MGFFKKGTDIWEERRDMNISQARFINAFYSGPWRRMTNYGADMFGNVFTANRVGMTRTLAKSILAGATVTSDPMISTEIKGLDDIEVVSRECNIGGKFLKYGRISSLKLPIPSMIEQLSGVKLNEIRIRDDALIILSDSILRNFDWLGLLQKITVGLQTACKDPEKVEGTWNPSIHLFEKGISLQTGISNLTDFISQMKSSFVEGKSATYDLVISVDNHKIKYVLEINAMYEPRWGIPHFSFSVPNRILMR